MLLASLLTTAHSFAAGSTAQVTCLYNNGLCDTGLPTVNANSGALQTVLQIVFAVLAALAVLFVVLGGLRYVTSQGNPEGTAKARSTIIYAVIGLVIAVSAEGLVTFALNRLGS